LRLLREKRFKDAGTLNTPGKLPDITCTLRWLGQSGFSIQIGSSHLVIDLYLSDFLAKKYAGKEFHHKRMMSPPVTIDELNRITAYLCTHGHSDHMDPETFPRVMKNNPSAIAVIPTPLKDRALDLGVSPSSILPAEAGGSISLPGADITISAVPSAHEELQTDENGRHLFLGYVIGNKDCRIYHSGDCIPYEGLPETIGPLNPDIALLPVNGRNAYLKSRNIAGNFTIEEAVELCRKSAIPNCIVHHFGMFDFNTADMVHVNNFISNLPKGFPEVIIPEPGDKIHCIKTG